MEFNIALNSIVYLMIFIFPGILFRKFLYVREFSTEFNSGNLFERFIWTLIASIGMLLVTSGVHYLLIKVLDFGYLSSISYETVRNTFVQLSSNNLPDPKEKNIGNIYFDFALLMLSVYIFSIFFGLISYIIARSSIIRSSGFFKGPNYFQDLVKGAGHSNSDDSLIYGYTLADVLVDAGEESKLYSGRVKN